MPTLSSCYFCGTALDASLEEYPVVPQALDPPAELQGNVVLCDSCKQKLARVLDPVVRAARQEGAPPRDKGTDRQGGEARQGGTADEGRRRGNADESRQRGTPDESRQSGTASDHRDAGGAGERPQQGTADERRQPGTPNESRQGREQPDRAETRQPTDDGPDATFDDPQQDPVFGDADDEGDDSDPHEPVFGSEAATVDGDDAPVDDAEGEADPLTGAGNSGPEADPEEGGTTTVTETSVASGGGDSPSVKTYNRVMRLLENREFPVEEAAIREVADSAYDIPEAEFEAVIQEAVDNGVLQRSKGKLTR